MKVGLLATALSATSILLGCGGGSEATPDAEVTSCIGDIAWYSENSEGQAEEAGVKDPNAFGLYDMLGNATEWVSDCYHETYDGAPTDGSSWDETTCDYVVVRGGCYGSTARGLRVSVREGVETNFYGTCAPTVRCVREPGTADQGVAQLTWVSIPGGTFDMGCSTGDEDCYDNENPQHSVTVAAFEMMDTEATQEQYHDQTGLAPATYYCPECAVTYVDWTKATEFCAAVGGRLPTEAEWEYAARGGTATRYYCGNN